MKNCPTCGAQNADDALICENCGNRLEQPKPAYQEQPQQSWQQSQQSWQQPQQSWQQPQQNWQQTRQQPAPAPAPAPAPVTPVNVYMNANQLPAQYQPLSPWAYFGYTLLYCIPIVGFIFLIVFALSDDNINRRNHARSYFCGLIISLIIGVVVAIIAAIAGVSIFSAARYY